MNNNNFKKIIVITGPTASGKTELSINIAKTFNAEIINADAVQIYKNYNIGSAKINEKEKQGIKHHLIDIVEPDQNYSIYNFQKDCRKIIPNIKLPILVGGSGLYIKAALFNYELNPIPKKFINYKKNVSQNNINFMLQQIQQKDPNLILDTKNPRRIINAFIDLNSEQLRSQKKRKNQPMYNILTIYLDIDRKILKERVTKRLEKMLQIGFIEETKEILQKFPKSDLNIIGYREIKNFLANKMNLEETKKLIIKKTMQYAKRQKTWFKNQMSAQIIDALDSNLTSKAADIIKKFLKD